MTSKLLTAAAVRDALGGVSDMTLWRWLDLPPENRTLQKESLFS